MHRRPSTTRTDIVHRFSLIYYVEPVDADFYFQKLHSRSTTPKSFYQNNKPFNSKFGWSWSLLSRDRNRMCIIDICYILLLVVSRFLLYIIYFYIVSIFLPFVRTRITVCCFGCVFVRALHLPIRVYVIFLHIHFSKYISISQWPSGWQFQLPLNLAYLIYTCFPAQQNWPI